MLKRKTSCLVILALSSVAGAEDKAVLAPVTVTARHVEESAGALPFSVERFSERDLDNRRVGDLESLLWNVPGVQLNSFGSPGQTSIKIRGVGALNKVSLDDASVMLYQNGVPQPLYKLTGDLLDMSGVEVLKGPQGTLFGRNSEAGVVNLKPNKPESEFGGHVGIDAGSRGRLKGDAALNLPLSEKWAVRLALRAAKKHHVYTNSKDGEPFTRPTDAVARLSLRRLDETDDILLSAEYERKEGYLPGSTLLEGPVEMDMARDDEVNHLASNHFLALEWTHRWKRFHLKSATGYGSFDMNYTAPFEDERVGRRLYGAYRPSKRTIEDGKTHWFQELHLASNEDADFFWLIGANYYGDKREVRYLKAWKDDPFWPGNPFNADLNPRFEHDSFGVFGEATRPLFGGLDLTLGARYGFDKVAYANEWIAHDDWVGKGDRRRSEKNELKDHYLTGRVGLSLEVAKDARIYANLARGHKPGDFSEWDTNIASGEPSTPYKAATIDATEIGVKADLFEKRARVEAALFYNRTRDDHVYAMANPAVSFASIIENHDTRSRGGELSLAWKLNERLSIKGAFAYTDAVITGKPEKSFAPDIKVGNRVPDVPKIASNLSAEYRHPVTLPFGMGAGRLLAHVNWNHVGSRPADAENHFDLKANNRIDASIGVAGGSWEMRLWGVNLLDSHRELYGYYIPATPPEYGGTGLDARTGAVGEGRILGGTFRYRF